MASDYSNKNILEVLRSSWFIIVFIGLVVIGWTRMEAELQDHEARLLKVEAQQIVADDRFNRLEVNIQAVLTSLEFIKEKLK